MGKYLVFILNSDTHCKVFAEHVVSPQQIEMSVYLKHVHTVRQCCLSLQWPNIHSKLINGRDNLRKQQWWSPASSSAAFTQIAAALEFKHFE